LKVKYIKAIEKAQEEAKRPKKAKFKINQDKFKKLKYYDKQFGIKVRFWV